ncbi:MAG TPA: chemotaxis protein CheW [Porticoccaceae bacterium]|nr:chemotaxis protein CheW [Porticoccaceae bacterium]
MNQPEQSLVRRTEVAAMEKWVTFGIEQEIYGIKVLRVQEVLRVPEIAPVPGAPPYVLGIINLRGNVVTVIDMRNRLRLGERAYNDQTRIIVVETRGQIAGILVDRVDEVIELSAENLAPLPNVGERENSRFLSGVAHRGDDVLILVDVDQLLSAEHRELLATPLLVV